MIDVHEGRDIKILDVPGTSFHAKVLEDEMFLMTFQREFVIFICKTTIYPEYNFFWGPPK